VEGPFLNAASGFGQKLLIVVARFGSASGGQARGNLSSVLRVAR
jgi:hypothetical protein